MIDLSGRWDILLLDPPWSYSNPVPGIKNINGQRTYATHVTGADVEYPTMTNVDIENLHPERLLTDRGIVFMWATGPKMDSAFDAIGAWGLYYRGMAFVWVKTKMTDGTPVGAKGPRASIVKSLAEFVVVASNVKSGRPFPIADETVSQIVMAPRREHSRKPDEVHDRIERLYPLATKLEIFSRPPLREGWDHWGNEVGSQIGSHLAHESGATP